VRQRGRKSAASQSVVNLAVVDVSREKPEPLEHLTPEQQQVWREVVAAMKPGSFNAATFPLLASYCSHVTWARFIAAELHEMRHQIRPKKGQSFAVDAQQSKRNALDAGNKTAFACKNKYAPSQAGQ
jgi:phage terminase small subunit